MCRFTSSARNKIGGASRDRTDDPLLAKQVLSQLSYGPMLRNGKRCNAIERDTKLRLAGLRSLDAGHLCGRLDRQSAVFSL